MNIPNHTIGWHGNVLYFSGQFWYAHDKALKLTGSGDTKEEALAELRNIQQKAKRPLLKSGKKKLLRDIYKEAIVAAMRPGENYFIGEIHSLIRNVFQYENSNYLTPYLTALIQEGVLTSEKGVSLNKACVLYQLAEPAATVSQEDKPDTATAPKIYLRNNKNNNPAKATIKIPPNQ